MKRSGRKSAAQTPAPISERIKGSKRNPKGSAASSESANKINLSDNIVQVLKDKADAYNEKHPKNKVSVSTLKAVFRRGAGAYSSSHRPTITGGRPNSRTAWAYARVNKFLLKKGGTKVKAAYVQDDDLMAKGGKLSQEITCVNCGWHWNTEQSDELNKYICHKCGFDNRTYYDSDPIGKYHLGGDMSKHLAPNGKPSNLTHEQWHLVRTPEFKAWFGDWENDPQNASKVIDENGEPLVVYHGTSVDFTIFKSEKPTIAAYGKGFYFTNDKGFAQNYARGENGKILHLFLNARKIFEIYEDKLPIGYEKYSDMENNKGTSRDFTNKLISQGYDGVYAKNKYNENEIVAFESNQIKLADGTNTTFDANNPDIRYEEGGEIFKPTLTIQDLARKHNVTVSEVLKKLTLGIEKELEHTEDEEVAKIIALHHIEENIEYYDVLKENELEEGAIIEDVVIEEKPKLALPDTYADVESLKDILAMQGYEIKPMVEAVNEENEEIMKKGGVVVGKSHQESDENGTGEKFVVASTGQIVELEGGEAVIVNKAMDSSDMLTFEGKEMTPKEIASYLNHAYGGVKFEQGGEVTCGCSHKKYYHGGELPSAVVDGLQGGEAVITKKTMESNEKYMFEGQKLTPRQILSRINHKYGGVSFARGGITGRVKHSEENKMSKMIYFINNVNYG